jgi:hypothetical protein
LTIIIDSEKQQLFQMARTTNQKVIDNLHGYSKLGKGRD